MDKSKAIINEKRLLDSPSRNFLSRNTYFIFDQWSLDVALQWDAKVSNLLNRISEHKNLCPPSKKFIGLRRCAITEYTSLLYRVKDDKVELITFFDNRSKHPF